MFFKLHLLISPYLQSIMCFSYEAFQSSLVFYLLKEDSKGFVSKQGIIRQLFTRFLQQHILRIQPFSLCQSLLDLLL